jgi:hypothetical protein
MSVKKSLWISLALVMAMSLVFLGCPTEASNSSTGERPAYEKTALWEAILDAQGVLNATPVTALKDADAGKDIVEGTKWVTQTQYDAFSRDIESARTVAYGLRSSVKAITPTPEEQPALDELADAQTQFNAYKELQVGTGEEAKTVAALVAGGDLVIVGNVVLDDTTDATLNTAALITVAGGAKLTTSATKKFNLTNTGVFLRIKSGGTLEILGTTDVGDGNFVGKIIVEDGGTFIDRTEGGLFVDASNDVGSYEISAGGVLISGTTVLVGPTAGANSGQKFQLKSGEITVAFGDTYTLDGDADMVGSLEIGGLAIDGTLTVADKVDLSGDDATTLLTGEDGAKIILAGTGSSITVLDSSSWDNVADSAAAIGAQPIRVAITGVTWAFGGGNDGIPFHSGHTVSGFRTTGTAILQYDAGTTVEKWVKQK